MLKPDINNVPDDSAQFDRTILSHPSPPCKKEFKNKAYKIRKYTCNVYGIVQLWRSRFHLSEDSTAIIPRQYIAEDILLAYLHSYAGHSYRDIC